MKRSVDRLGLLIYSSDSYATCFTAGAESRVPLRLGVHRLPLKIPLRLRCGPVYICCRIITTRPHRQRDRIHIPQRSSASSIPQRSSASSIPQRSSASPIPQRSSAYSIPQRPQRLLFLSVPLRPLRFNFRKL